MPSDIAPPITGQKLSLSSPHLGGKESLYLDECIQSGWVSSGGPFVGRFEQQLAEYVGTKFAVATSTGTAAIHLALQVSGVQPDDEVLVPSLTFIAPANAVRYLNAWPVLMDSDPVYWQMDIEKVREFLHFECHVVQKVLRNRQSGRRVSAILPVHVLGHPVDMAPITALAAEFDLKVIEDATESLGSEYQGKRTGSIGHLGCFSFNGNKIITTGGGGMITTDDPLLAERARYLSTQAKDDPIEYVHGDVGYNYRLTNIQAALGVAQMEQLPSFVAAKKGITSIYNGLLSGIPGIQLPQQSPKVQSNCWLYTILIDQKIYGEDSREVLQRMRLSGFESRPFWRPIHLQKPFQACESYKIEVADTLYGSALSLPCSVGITEQQIDQVCAVLQSQL